MRQECATNEKGACTDCGILFVRRSGGNPKDPSIFTLVLLGTILRQAQDKLSLRNNTLGEPHSRMIPTKLAGLNASCNAAAGEARGMLPTQISSKCGVICRACSNMLTDHC